MAVGIPISSGLNLLRYFPETRDIVNQNLSLFGMEPILGKFLLDKLQITLLHKIYSRRMDSNTTWPREKQRGTTTLILKFPSDILMVGINNAKDN